SGLFFSETPPRDYRDWATSDYTFYEALAPQLHDLGVLCEPDSREPWFICEAHDERCLAETLERFEIAVERVVNAARSSGPGTAPTTERLPRSESFDVAQLRQLGLVVVGESLHCAR